VVVCVLGVAVLATAANNKFGVAEVHRINFVNSVRVGDVVLPRGDYEIRHAMEGDNHIMIFQRVGGKAAEARVKCELVPLTQKASQTQRTYVTNASNEQVLHELVFAGETAKHVF
jgi:hypothetical protein